MMLTKNVYKKKLTKRCQKNAVKKLLSKNFGEKMLTKKNVDKNVDTEKVFTYTIDASERQPLLPKIVCDAHL